MDLALLLERRVHQLSVATNILGGSTMLHHAPCHYIITSHYAFLQRYVRTYMEEGYSPLYIHYYD